MLKRNAKLLIVDHSLLIACCLLFHLVLETLALDEWVVQLRVRVYNFLAVDEQLQPLR